MDGRSPPLLLLFLFLFLFLFSSDLQQLGISHAASISTAGCPAAEWDALMELKRGLRDPSGRLSSWVGRDCCSWDGVGCSNTTGRVTQLDLNNRRQSDSSGDCSDETIHYWTIRSYGCRWALFGGITPSLISLQHLQYLDLSGNFFQHEPIPAFLGSFTKLTYLNLSGAGFRGKVPDQLGNLSGLHQLDLSNNVYTKADNLFYRGLYLENAGWISQLTSLQYLDMTWVSFEGVDYWLQALNALTRIETVHLANCALVDFPLSLPHINFTSLTVLDLSSNDFNSNVPNWLFKITSLEHFDSRWNKLNWPNLTSITEWASLRMLDLTANVFENGFELEAFSNLCKLQTLRLRYVVINQALDDLKPVFSRCLMFSLEELELSSTQINGSLPDWLASMEKLRHLELSDNSLSGSLPASLGRMSLLQHLDLGSNYFDGEIPEGAFGQMKALNTMYLGDNSLSLSYLHLANLSSLKYLDISYNTFVLSGNLSDWIPSFQLEYLLLRSCNILPKPHFPKWLQTQKTLYFLDMENTDIREAFPSWLPATLRYLFLSQNKITGYIPQYLSNLTNIDLSNNSFSGHLPSGIANVMPAIEFLDLSMNDLSGSIPSSICQNEQLIILRLAKNNLSGVLPDCWKKSNPLVLDLSGNNLQGGIPSSFCNMTKLQVLQMSSNGFSGQIPACLKDCTKLVWLDLGYIRLVGDVPAWIEETLLDLNILILRSNSFTGIVPLQISRLQYLQILDLSNNNISGIIPPSFGNFSALRNSSNFEKSAISVYVGTVCVTVDMKGSNLDYCSSANYVGVIDLSNNGLSGSIPDGLWNLNLLQSLNLSGNYLTGEIPRNIDGIHQLEVLDLSRNNLSGQIPSSLAFLNFLDYLNLSYNHLSGRIPSGNQLQTLVDPSIYAGNKDLCGFPLLKNCTDKVTDKEDEEQEDNGKSNIDTVWLSTSTALGFIVGFWAIWGTLLLKRSWRFAYLRSIDDMSMAMALKAQQKLKGATKKTSLRRRRR